MLFRKEFIFSLLILSLCFSAFAQKNGKPFQAYEGKMDGDERARLLQNARPEGPVDPERFSSYLYDDCEEVSRNADNEQILRQKGLRRCEDLTVSFVQPKSTFSGYEGKCGQTAGSNLIYGYCSFIMDPKKDVERYMRDISPGVRPDTMSRGMNDIFWEESARCPGSGQWKWLYHKSSQAYIDTLNRALKTASSPRKTLRKLPNGALVYRSPVALLIRTPGSHSLHWITLVDMEKSGQECFAMVNHWDNQYKVPCSTLAKWSKGVASSYPLIFNPYNIVVYTDS